MSIQRDQELNQVIAERILELRKRQQLSQQDIADNLGIKQQSYAKYEAGKRRIPVNALPALAQALNTTIENLLDIPRARQKRGRISQLEQRFQKIQQLPKKEQRFVIEALDRLLQSS